MALSIKFLTKIRAGRLAPYITAACYFFISIENESIASCIYPYITIQGCYVITHSPKKLLSNPLKPPPYDAIIVPGVGFQNEKWGLLMKQRIYWASFLQQKSIAENIIFSGAAVSSPYVEAKILALYAEAVGINPETILLETKAEHSKENLVFSYNLAVDKGFKNVALATDPYQANFLFNYIRKKKMPVTVLPFNLDSMEVMLMPDVVIDYNKAIVADLFLLKNVKLLLKEYGVHLEKN